MPDHGKLQLAGWIGFVSPGIGYAWLDRRLEADLFLGWVPPALGGEPIVSLTSKVTALPLRLRWRELAIQPLTLSAQLTWTLGSEYWIRQPDRYPDGYYPLPSALRAGVGVGGAVGRALGRLEHVALYYEVVALDVMLGHWIGNPGTIGPSDALSLAFGVRLEH